MSVTQVGSKRPREEMDVDDEDDELDFGDLTLNSPPKVKSEKTPENRSPSLALALCAPTSPPASPDGAQNKPSPPTNLFTPDLSVFENNSEVDQNKRYAQICKTLDKEEKYKKMFSLFVSSLPSLENFEKKDIQNLKRLFQTASPDLFRFTGRHVIFFKTTKLFDLDPERWMQLEGKKFNTTKFVYFSFYNNLSPLPLLSVYRVKEIFDESDTVSDVGESEFVPEYDSSLSQRFEEIQINFYRFMFDFEKRRELSLRQMQKKRKNALWGLAAYFQK